jgi:predicted TPR repeat methyltransferase
MDKSKSASAEDLLQNAYKLGSPADNVAYYRDFAPLYEGEFVACTGYDYPRQIARAYRLAAGQGDVPIADIGCGTGLVAMDLGVAPEDVEGMDISPEMLAIARDRGLYGALHEVDLTGRLDRFAGRFGAVLSAGTFTHGHLGPGPLRGLLEIARPGGLFVIGVNRAHFEAEGFGAVLEAMTGGGEIGEVGMSEVDIYGEAGGKAGHAHAGDRALVLQYRKR